MVFARHILAVLTVFALAFAPVNPALAAGAPEHGAMHAPHAANPAEAGHHDCHTMQMAAAHGHAVHEQAAVDSAHQCKDGHDCCGGDKGTCADSCVQKCFGQVAVVPPARMMRLTSTEQFARGPAQRPPGWAYRPQPPPPRA